LFHARQFEDARKYLHSTVEHATLARNRLVASFELMLIGAAYMKSGDLTQAKGFLEEAMGYAKHRGSKLLEGLAAKYCAELALNMGEIDTAGGYIRDCFEAGKPIGNLPRVLDSAELLGLVQELRGNNAEAIELLACADQARENAGIPLQPSQSVEVEATLDVLLEKIGQTAFRAHWSNGRQQDIEVLLNKSFSSAELDV
jgi:tetratricopeptide (TPR) repeat protein